MGPYCKFCNQRCFAHLPAETPKRMLEAYGTNTTAATCPKGQEFEKERLGYCWADIQAALKREGTPGPLEIRFGHDVTGYPTFMIAGMSGPEKIDADLLEGYRRMLEASANSYARHCGLRAVECAEADLLGESLDALQDLRDKVQASHVDGEGRIPGCGVCMALDNADEVLARAAKATGK